MNYPGYRAAHIFISKSNFTKIDSQFPELGYLSIVAKESSSIEKNEVLGASSDRWYYPRMSIAKPFKQVISRGLEIAIPKIAKAQPRTIGIRTTTAS